MAQPLRPLSLEHYSFPQGGRSVVMLLLLFLERAVVLQILGLLPLPWPPINMPEQPVI